MEENIRNIIKSWYERSTGREVEFTIFDKFISLWISFNAWMSYKSGKKRDKMMVNWAAKELEEFYREILKSNSRFKEKVKQLKEYTPIYDSRDSTRFKEISDINNFSEVLFSIYKIRCNLFHGGKKLISSRDERLVGLAYEILSSVFYHELKNEDVYK